MLGFVSCSDDEENCMFCECTSPSGRDYIYSGEQLSVYLGDEIMKGVTADVKTCYMDAGDSGTKQDENGNDYLYFGSNFFMTIVLTGFPTASEKTTLNTILLHYDNFSGRDMIKGKFYKYTGEFTNSPLHHPDNQGLIIHFTAE